MAEPKIISYKEKGIKLDNIKEGIPINIFQKKGVPFSIKVEQDSTYLVRKPKIEYYQKDQKFVREVILKDKQLWDLIGALKRSFMSTDNILYGFYIDGKAYFYHMFANTNFFTYSDMKKIRDFYKYGERGFNLLESIFSGYEKPENVLSIISEYIKENHLSVDDIFIIPEHQEISAPTYKYLDSIVESTDLDQKEDEFVEEKKEEKLPELPVIDFPKEEEKTIENITEDEIEKLLNQLEEKKGISTCQNEIIDPHLHSSKDIKLISKDFSYTLRNLRLFIKENDIKLTENEFNIIVPLAAMWTYWSNYEIMATVRKYITAACDEGKLIKYVDCLLYTSPSPRDKRQSRMPSSA